MRSRSGEWPRPRSHVVSTHSVVLYHAPGCHLCEGARRVLMQVRGDMPFELEEVDITGDEELERSYRERIPVVLVDGEEAFTYFVHPEGLRRRISS
jgi:glutaredoxin